jgi:hypothetical protein
MPAKGKKVDTGNWGLHPIVTSFVNLRWELNRNGKVVVFGRDAALTCIGYSAVKQLLSFAVPMSLGDSDTKVRVVIHSLIYDLLILMNDR